MNRSPTAGVALLIPWKRDLFLEQNVKKFQGGKIHIDKGHGIYIRGFCAKLDPM